MPSRSPLVTSGGRVSSGTRFRLARMPHSSRARSATTPVMGRPVRSISTMWLSVPPVRTRWPSADRASARAAALSTTRRIVSLKAGSATRARARAFAAMAAGFGVPCDSGKTARCISRDSGVRPSGPGVACSRPIRISPPRGPPSCLYVLVVVACARSTGVGCSPAATSPAMCEMSATRYAPTESAIARKRAKSSVRGWALAPAMSTLGRWSSASAATCA